MGGRKMMLPFAVPYPKLAPLAGLAISLVLVCALSIDLQATFETGTDQRGYKASVTQPGHSGPAPTANAQANAPRSQNSNPRSSLLWGTPLASLSIARERPIFNPARRTPAVFETAAAPPQLVDNQPHRPLLSLVGAVAGDTYEVAIFLDEQTKSIVRLKTGENHSGWTLQVVKGREATLQKDRETVTLAIATPPAR